MLMFSSDLFISVPTLSQSVCVCVCGFLPKLIIPGNILRDGPEHVPQLIPDLVKQTINTDHQSAWGITERCSLVLMLRWDERNLVGSQGWMKKSLVGQQSTKGEDSL